MDVKLLSFKTFSPPITKLDILAEIFTFSPVPPDLGRGKASGLNCEEQISMEILISLFVMTCLASIVFF